jgi:hypothetical protein
MNFLSHYYLDSEKDNIYFNFGLILPDLMGIYRRGWKLSSKQHKFDGIPELREILRGVIKHYELDSVFHQSGFFRKFTDLMADQLNAEGEDLPTYKRHFIAHILLELIIDRVIIKKHKKVAVQFYNDLVRLDLEIIRKFFLGEPPDLLEGFINLVNRFRFEQNLYKYLDNDIIVFSLNRVLARVKVFNIAEGQEKERVISITTRVEKMLSDDFNSIKKIREENYLE